MMTTSPSKPLPAYRRADTRRKPHMVWANRKDGAGSPITELVVWIPNRVRPLIYGAFGQSRWSRDMILRMYHEGAARGWRDC